MLRAALCTTPRGASAAPRRLLHAARRLRIEVKKVEVTIDGNKVQVPATATVIQACEVAGVEIPRFCYHDRCVCVFLRALFTSAISSCS